MTTYANVIYGYDLPGGFKDFQDALLTIDHDRPPYGNLFKIRNQIFVLRNINGRPVFDFPYENEYPN